MLENLRLHQKLESRRIETMSDSNKAFSGQRLRVARLFRGKGQFDVGNALRISQQFIGDVEREAKSPSAELVRAFGDLLGFETEYFYGSTLDEFLDSQCNFRRRRTTPISIRNRALAYGTLLGQFWSYAAKQLNFPQDTMPILNASGKAEVERAVERCRNRWGLGLDTPIQNMVRIVEKAGVPVTRFGDVGEKVDAFSRAGQPSIVVLNSKPASRCRRDLAHECAHLVLHRNKPTGTPDIEREADHFARAFLLPRDGFRREFPRAPYSGIWEALFRLKIRWRVSLADLILRAADLSLINGVQYLRLYKELSKQGWLKAEPHEFEGESPEILPAVFEQLKASDVAYDLGWSLATLAEITGVPLEAKSRANVRNLPFAKRIEA
jgi:Zn-dependent peptidase ImmA (M78 family)/transcriptional regulator with XRE-family HTH domain